MTDNDLLAQWIISQFELVKIYERALERLRDLETCPHAQEIAREALGE